jgi:hypothetical protein
MTVKEYIEFLKTLDQDKGIWVTYDFPCDMFEPKPDEIAGDMHVLFFGEDSDLTNIGVKKGDYIISAG